MTIRSSDPIGAFPNPDPLPGWVRIDAQTFERTVDKTRVVLDHGGVGRWAVRSGPILAGGRQTWLRRRGGMQSTIFFEAYIDAMKAAERKWPIKAIDETKLSVVQRALARHALGLPNDGNISYRNRFVVGMGNSDYADWMAMTGKGYAVRRDGKDLMFRGDDLFVMTREGAELVLEGAERLDLEDFPKATGETKI